MRIIKINLQIYFLNSFSIEDIKNNKKDGKKKVICFDDLERKSDSINMKELLGLIERASINFDVILIANTKEFEEEDLNVFNLYKEIEESRLLDNKRTTSLTMLRSLRGRGGRGSCWNSYPEKDIWVSCLSAWSGSGFVAENV